MAARKRTRVECGPRWVATILEVLEKEDRSGGGDALVVKFSQVCKIWLINQLILNW